MLVLGATGAAGQILDQAAKLLGAAHVTAVGRDPDRLEQTHASSGADEVVRLDGDFGEPTCVFVLCGGGRQARRRCSSFNERGSRAARPVPRVIRVPASSAASRGKQLVQLLLRGSRGRARGTVRGLVAHALAGRIRLDVERYPLDGAGAAWAQ